MGSGYGFHFIFRILNPIQIYVETQTCIPKAKFLTLTDDKKRKVLGSFL